MLIGKTLKMIESGKYRTLPDLERALDVTAVELKGILDILVATGKLKKTEQSLGGKTCASCNATSRCSGCLSGCNIEPSMKQDEKSLNVISFYQPI